MLCLGLGIFTALPLAILRATVSKYHLSCATLKNQNLSTFSVYSWCSVDVTAYATCGGPPCWSPFERGNVCKYTPKLHPTQLLDPL